jgi:hypothetical protein
MVAAVSRGLGPAAARGAVPDVLFVRVAAPTTEGDGIWSFAASVGALGVAAAMLKEKLALPRKLPSATA